MTNREIFDFVKGHLLRQNAKAVNGPLVLPNEDNGGSGMCRYRTNDGLKCAVGCLIDEEDYSVNMEGQRVGEAFKYDVGERGALLFHALTKKGITQENVELLTKLQVIHDTKEVAFWSFFLDQLEQQYFGEKRSR